MFIQFQQYRIQVLGGKILYMLWQWLKFEQLTLEQLYALTEEDVDGLDIQAIHLLGYEQDRLMAYARVLPPSKGTNFVSFLKKIL